MVAELIALIEAYGLAFVFVNVLMEQGGLPIPAYPVLIVSAGLASRGRYGIGDLLLVGTGAALLADLAWYWRGRRYGRRLLAVLCRISLSPDYCVRQTESIFTRWGPVSLLVAKFVPGFASLATVLAGIVRLRPFTFLVLDGLGAALWVGVAVALGVAFQSAVADVLAVLVALGRWGGALVGGLLALFVLSRWWQRARFARQLRMDRITVDELGELLRGGATPVILDVRAKESLAEAGLIPGATAVDRGDLDHLAATVPAGTEIIIYCSCPNEASAAEFARLLSRRGFKRIRPLLGGVDAWVAAGQSLVPFVR
jgi:membrane protein DedA with SNARE-associated domain/rhodanese-related sulfurtransferase